jgi:hypothetical protein
MNAPFPLITLQPVCETRNAWVALSLEAARAPDASPDPNLR